MNGLLSGCMARRETRRSRSPCLSRWLGWHCCLRAKDASCIGLWMGCIRSLDMHRQRWTLLILCTSGTCPASRSTSRAWPCWNSYSINDKHVMSCPWVICKREGVGHDRDYLSCRMESGILCIEYRVGLPVSWPMLHMHARVIDHRRRLRREMMIGFLQSLSGF